MYKVCQTEQSAARQRELELGLLNLLEHRRYEDISVSDLCQHLNIPRKSFYRYFSGKDGALFALIDHTLADFFELSPEDKQGTALGDLDLYFVFWHRNRRLLDALIRSDLTGILVERSNAFALTEGHFPQRMKSWHADRKSLALAFALCGLISMVIQWHKQNYSLTPQEMTQLATDMLTQPLLR